MRSRLGELWDAANDIENYGRCFQTALGRLYDTAEDIAAIAGSDRQAVGEVVGTWRDELQKIAGRTTIKPNATPLLEDLHSLAKEAVEDDPFQEILEKVKAEASAVYDEYWRKASLSLCHVRKHPRPGGDDPYAIDATTKIVDDQAKIELHIYPPDFSPAAYAAIPLIFVHECICHVPARQEKNKNLSAFAEGFLDWAAVFFFERWITRLDVDLTPAARQHAAQLSEVLKQEPNPAWAQRSDGHRRAEVLTTWLQVELGRSVEEARTKVARLAVELNRTDAPLAKKDLFVSRLRTPLPSLLQSRFLAWEAGATPAADLLEAF